MPRYRRPFCCRIFELDTLLILCIAIATGAISYGVYEFGQNVNKVTEEVQMLKNNEEGTSVKLQNIENTLQDIKNAQLSRWQKSKRPPPIEEPKKQNVSDEEIRKIVMKAIEEYVNERTTKADFALESAGGKIISTGDTEQYNSCSGGSSLFGIILCEVPNGPQALIQANMQPGECWAFKGSSGFAIMQLLGYVFINGVSLEHIPKSFSPTGDIDSAPKQFSIWGLPGEQDTDAQLFGQFVYDSTGPAIQYFEIEETPRSYKHIKFKIHSNYGNLLFTCVYRLQVHGRLDPLGASPAGKYD